MAYADTNHLFSQPVRYYKANDPYFYEVDNIPIRQLEENILWAKDQIASILSPPSGAEPITGSPLFVGDDLDLDHVKQLRPKFSGGRSITVQAGKFTARVNDAFEVNDSLAQMIATFDSLPGKCATVPALSESDTTAFFDAVWASYTTKLTTATFVSCPGESNEAAAYRANGLETMYTFYISSDFGWPIPTATFSAYGAPEYEEDGSGRGRTWPGLWHSDISNFFGQNNIIALNKTHVKLVQHWRGVIRTSVVDFRGETIDIQPFDAYDYWYAEDVNGTENVVSLQDLATQRIDLLVVYTHPIDASGSNLAEYVGVNPIATATPSAGNIVKPKKIFTPSLGIIRGAGIGIKRKTIGGSDGIELLDKRIVPGEQKILANLNDHTDGASNTGIKLRNGSIIHGSFPSPDDLANIAPNLTLGLADNDLQLVGQTVLPIAYIVVNKSSTNLSQDDIIDIRPFFRTTELSYNERAGIAGANPAISFANPVVGQAQIVKVSDCLEGMIDAKIAAIPIVPPVITTTSTTSEAGVYLLSSVVVTSDRETVAFSGFRDDTVYRYYTIKCKMPPFSTTRFNRVESNWSSQIHSNTSKFVAFRISVDNANSYIAHPIRVGVSTGQRHQAGHVVNTVLQEWSSGGGTGTSSNRDSLAAASVCMANDTLNFNIDFGGFPAIPTVPFFVGTTEHQMIRVNAKGAGIGGVSYQRSYHGPLHAEEHSSLSWPRQHIYPLTYQIINQFSSLGANQKITGFEFRLAYEGFRIDSNLRIPIGTEFFLYGHTALTEI